MLGYVIQKPCKNHLELIRFFSTPAESGITRFEVSVGQNLHFGVFAHSSQLNTFKAGLDVKVTNVREANGGSLSRFYCELKKRLQVEKGKLNLRNSLDSGIIFHSEKKQQKITGSFYIDDVFGFNKKRQTLYIFQDKNLEHIISAPSVGVFCFVFVLYCFILFFGHYSYPGLC